MAQKNAIIKRSAIFTHFFETLSKLPTIEVIFDQVLKKLGENCGIFNNSIIQGHMCQF